MLMLLSGYKLALGAGLSLAVALVVRAMIMAKWGPATPGPAPPGPRGVPLLGTALSLDFNSMIGSFAGVRQLAKKYGNVFQVKSVGQSVVVLHGYETIREALVGHAELFEDRPVMPMFEHMLEGHGMATAVRQPWKSKLVVHQGHSHGTASHSHDTLLFHGCLCCVSGAPWDPKTMISCAVSNVICSLSFGKRFTYEDKEFIKLVALLSENVRLLASPVSQINNIFTFLRHLPGPHTRLFENVRRLKAFLSSFIEVHRNAPEQDEPQDFIAAFLARQRKEAGNPDTYFTDKALLVVTLNLFFAGTETTSTTL
uniref:Uncharacterized protein n=1 Tax=Petromyzon marinus TaxID=7757 RepID=S4R714_PETMA